MVNTKSIPEMLTKTHQLYSWLTLQDAGKWSSSYNVLCHNYSCFNTDCWIRNINTSKGTNTLTSILTALTHFSIKVMQVILLIIRVDICL